MDLTYYGNQHQLEYDFDLAPGADPSRIRLRFVDRAGKAQPLAVDAAGDLVIRAGSGEVRQRKPLACQHTDGRRHEVACRYILLPKQTQAPRRLE